MNRYVLVETYYFSIPHIHSTDPVIYDAVLKAVQELAPDATYRSIAGYQHYRVLHQLDNHDHEIFDFILRWLCTHGFEPFSVYPGPQITSSSYAYSVYNFRRLLD